MWIYHPELEEGQALAPPRLWNGWVRPGAAGTLQLQEAGGTMTNIIVFSVFY